jgi:hypothetical protein
MKYTTKLRNYRVLIDGKEIPITGGVEITYNPNARIVEVVTECTLCESQEILRKLIGNNDGKRKVI